jgi:hypothetical protein
VSQSRGYKIVFWSVLAGWFFRSHYNLVAATIQQQLETLQSVPSPAELAEKTIDYAEAKTAYFEALRARCQN